MEDTVFPGFDFPITARAVPLVIDMQPCGAPRPGDRVLTKTSMDVFTSTRLAEELRVGGIVVDDACAAWEEGFHAASLRSLSRYFARIASTGEVVSGIEGAAGDGGTG
jgi:isochorismate hydrolase